MRMRSLDKQMGCWKGWNSRLQCLGFGMVGLIILVGQVVQRVAVVICRWGLLISWGRMVYWGLLVSCPWRSRMHWNWMYRFAIFGGDAKDILQGASILLRGQVMFRWVVMYHKGFLIS